MAHTCINDQYGRAPKRRILQGDKARPEPGTHIIEFPGGAMELSRLDDGSYWAHIAVYRGRGIKADQNTYGTVVDSRIDWAERRMEDIPHVPDEAHLTQLSVRIMPAARPLTDRTTEE